MSLHTDRRWSSWLSGAVSTTWSWTRSKQWRWLWTSGETPLFSPHSPSYSTVTAVDSFRLLGTTISQDLKWDTQQRLYFLRQLRKFSLPQELLKQFYPATIESVNNCLVQLSYKIWPQKTTEGNPDCWAKHWYNPPYSPRTALIQSEQKSCQNHSVPLTSSTLPLWTVTVWSTLQSSEHQNNQTQKQFLPSGNPWQTLDIKRGTHTIYTHTSFQMCTYLYIQLSICLLLFLIHLLYFYSFIICVFCPVTVILLHCGSFCHESRMCKHTWQ